MAKQISCECGAVIRGESDEEVIGAAEGHIRADHPDLVGQVGRDQLESWIEEV
jgi:predicted small metal-binding protein